MHRVKVFGAMAFASIAVADRTDVRDVGVDDRRGRAQGKACDERRDDRDQRLVVDGEDEDRPIRR